MERTRLPIDVFLGLGANLGERVATLQAAVHELAASGVTPLRCSPVYESAYVGPGAAQPPYLDLVVEARTRLAPLDLLRSVQAIERRHGREPETHMRPRTLDIDVLLYGGWLVRHPELVVPHPRLHERRFVLQPLADLGALASRPALRARLAEIGDAQPLRRLTEVTLTARGDLREVRVG